jgi:hypothetical protein
MPFLAYRHQPARRPGCIAVSTRCKRSFRNSPNSPAPAVALHRPAQGVHHGGLPNRRASTNLASGTCKQQPQGGAYIQGLITPLATLAGSAGMLMVLYYGGQLVISATITLGDFVAFITYLYMLIWPMMAIGWVANLVQRGLTSLNRIHAMLSTAGQQLVGSPASGETSPTSPTPASVCEHLTFAYDLRAAAPVLSGTSSLTLGPASTASPAAPAAARPPSVGCSPAFTRWSDGHAVFRRPGCQSAAPRPICARTSPMSARSRCSFPIPLPPTSPSARPGKSRGGITRAAQERLRSTTISSPCKDGYDDPHRRARRQTVGRPTAASCAGPRPAVRSSGVDYRRRFVRGRHRHRAPGLYRP